MSIVNLPRVNLGIFPTPVQELKNLSKVLGGPRIFAKREDLSGLGFGGNKARNLEFVMADIQKSGADAIINSMGSQSNYLVQLASAARKLNMDTSFIVYAGEHPQVQGNLLLQKVLGSKIKVIYSDRNSEEFQKQMSDEMDRLAREYKKAGHKPVVFKYGENERLDTIAAAGWATGAEELHNQLKEMEINANYLVVSVGTCITITGLITGLKLLKSPLKVIAVSVSRKKAEINERIMRMAKSLTKLMKWDIEVTPQDVTIYDDYKGERYGLPTKECMDAIKLMARAEGIFLDPVYTGKGFSGLVGLTKKGKLTAKDTVVFLASGGSTALFAYDKEILSSFEEDK